VNTNDLSRFTRGLARRDSDSASAARSREDLRLACIAHIKQTELRKTDPSGFAWETTFDKALAAYAKTFRRTSSVAKPNSRTTPVTTNTPAALRQRVTHPPSR
jgi:hypothetical protein